MAAEGAAEASILDGARPFPLAILRRSALDRNRAWMRAVAKATGASFCPHAKTYMSPELCAEQLEDGAWGLSAATVQQAVRLHAWGVACILLVNQVVDAANVRALVQLARAPELDLYVLVDSEEGGDRLAVAAASAPRPLQVLIEVGSEGGRTGIRGLEAATALARRIAAKPSLALRGIETFEYVFSGGVEAMDAGVETILAHAVDVARAVAAADLFAPGEVLLSAGGSSYYDRVVAVFGAADLGRPTRTVVRAGCVATHDHGMVARGYARLASREPGLAASGPSPEPALEVWTVVQSRPEPGLALLSAGKRDLSADIDLPTPVRWRREGPPQPLPPGHLIARLNDHHAYLVLPEGSPLKVGDLVGLGISHPCTTFDRWRMLPVVDDDERQVGLVRTYFREED